MSLIFQNLRKQYGANVATDDVSTDFAPGLIHGIIGPNGAGKSTLINLTAGSYTLTGGSILLDGKRLDGMKKFRISQAGVARTYQNIRLFDQMTALENLEVCFYASESGNSWREIFWPPYEAKQNARRREQAMAMLRLFDLQRFAHVESGSLPYGRQRMLEIARALVMNPRVLLLDEPAAGLNHHETAELTERLAALRHPDLIMIVVEHDMDLVMTLCDRIIVMHHGQLLFQGTPAEVQASAEVQLAYLGTADDIDDIKAAAESRRAKLGIRARQRS